MSDLIVGRFQPIHNGHCKIISQSDDPIIVIVYSKSLSERSPFSVTLREKMVKNVFPNTKIITAPNAFLPDIIETVQNKYNSTVNNLIIGDDREAQYLSQINRYNLKMNLKTVKRTIESATQVRGFIANNENKNFKKMIPLQNWGYWNMLVKEYNKTIKNIK